MMFSKSTMRPAVLKSCFCALFLFAGLSSAADYFPLSVGRYWTYYGGHFAGDLTCGWIRYKYTISVISKPSVLDTTKYSMRIDYSMRDTFDSPFCPANDFERFIKQCGQIDSAGYFDSVQTVFVTYCEVGDTVLLDQAWKWGKLGHTLPPLSKVYHSMHQGETLRNQTTCFNEVHDAGFTYGDKIFNTITNDSASTLIANTTDNRFHCGFGDGIGFLWYYLRCYHGSWVDEEGDTLIDYGINPSHIQGPPSPIRSVPSVAARLTRDAFDLLGRPMDFVASKRQVNGIVITRDKEGPGCRVLFPVFEDKADAGR